MYHVSGKAIEVPVPTYMMKNGSMSGQPKVTIVDRSGQPIESAVTIVNDAQGNQMMRVYSQNENLAGKYKLRLEATDCESGVKNQDAEIDLTIAEPVLKLIKLHSVFEPGNMTTYKPGGEPITIPLPQYKSASSQKVQYRITDKEGNPAPAFVRIESTTDKKGKESRQIVIQGKRQPEDRQYDLNVFAFDELTGSEQVHSFTV